MLRFAMGLVLAMSGTCAMADWVKVTESMQGKIAHYVDPSTIRKTGEKVQVTTLTDYQEAQVLSGTQQFLSVKMLDEFNCSDQTGRHLNLTALAGNMGAGKVVAAEIRPAGVRKIASDTADDDMFQFVCEKK
jgi:hypothetical protein